MLEMLLLTGKAKAVAPDGTGPGNNKILFSYSKGEGLLAGYYGRIDYTNLINGSDLATAIGLTAGAAMNDTVDWLKFYLDGKVLFIPQKPFRYGLAWKSLYDIGCVYGDDTIGNNLPSGYSTLQNKKVTIGDWQFRVRLMDVINNPPNTTIATDQSEWDRLFYSIVAAQVTGQQVDGTTKWDSFAVADLGLTGTNGIWTHSRSPYYYNSGYTGYRGVRGSSSITNKTGYALTTAATQGGWRPVLELIPPTT
jgi:hypothetical protein